MIKDKMKFQAVCLFFQSQGYSVIKSIGTGAFAEVFLVQNQSMELFAAKVINKETLRKKPYLEKYLMQQVKIMSKLEHPNVIKQHCFLKSNHFAIIIMQYCEKGNLLKYQSNQPKKSFQLKEAINILGHVIKGLKKIHEHNVIHRDIKAENILLSATPNGMTFKIADFGFAKSIQRSSGKTLCGTQKYMAPEIMQNSDYGTQVDVWALGVLFHFMLFCDYPFRGSKIREQISQRCTPYFCLSYLNRKKFNSKELEDFFKQVFVLQTSKRLTLDKLIELPLFRDIKGEVTGQLAEQISQRVVQSNQEEEQVQEIQKGLQPEDKSRIVMLNKDAIKNEEKHLQRELQQINYQVEKVLYLRQSAKQIFQTYKDIYEYPERLAARYYLLKLYLIYGQPLAQTLDKLEMPKSLKQTIEHSKWTQCTLTEYYKKLVEKLKYSNIEAKNNYEDTFNYASKIKQSIKIAHFQKSFKVQIEEKFEDIKVSYRHMTSYLFQKLCQSKVIDDSLKNRMKMRVFCCHMVNRVFDPNNLQKNFPFYLEWLKTQKLHYLQRFDFTYFKRWVLDSTQEALKQNIKLLRKNYF